MSLAAVVLHLPHLKRAQDAMHCDEVHLHYSPLLLAQIALDLVQHTAANTGSDQPVAQRCFHPAMTTAAL